MYFEIISAISEVRVIAAGVGVRQRRRLWRAYGRGAWRKMKGLAKIKLPDGTRLMAELPWYEAHGIGKKEFKIKRLFTQEG